MSTSATPALPRLERLMAMVESDPGNVKLLAECADLALAQGKAPEAQQFVARALALTPEDPHLRARAALVHIARREYGAAIEILEALVKAGVQAPPVRYNLGFALMHSARYAEAKEQLSHVADAEVPGARLLLARAHHYLGELDDAVRVAGACAASHPEDGAASGFLATLYLDRSDSAQAAVWAARSLASQQPAAEAHTVAAFLALGREDAGTADAGLDKALQLNPRSGRAWSGKGLVAMLGDNLENSEAAFHKALEDMPGHIGTWHALAWCQILRGKLDEAGRSLDRALELDRTFGETHGGIAVLAALRGNLEEAQRRTQIALRLQPDSPSAQYADLLLSRRDAGSAAQDVRKLLARLKTPGGGSLLDAVSRQAARRRPPGPPKH